MPRMSTRARCAATLCIPAAISACAAHNPAAPTASGAAASPPAATAAAAPANPIRPDGVSLTPDQLRMLDRFAEFAASPPEQRTSSTPDPAPQPAPAPQPTIAQTPPAEATPVEQTHSAAIINPTPEPLATEDPAPTGPPPITNTAAPTAPALPHTPSTSELAAQLAARIADSADPASALATAIRLAALRITTTAATARADAADLAPSEQRLHTALTTFFDALATSLGSADPAGAIPRLITDLSAAVSTDQPMAITTATLCSSASGFGIYDPLPTYADTHKFLAGRRHKAVIYCDLTGFSSTPTSQGGIPGYETRLSQDLRLSHFAKDRDTLAWRKPDLDLTDFCRSRRTDFYIAHLIELPETLSIGTYRLKITLTDKATAQRAEAIIPIEIVADPSALASPLLP